jgi:hypothetical protein
VLRHKVSTTFGGGVCFMLCVGENLIIAYSCLCNCSNCKKLHGFRKSNYNYQCRTCFFLRKSCYVAKTTRSAGFFCWRKKNVVQGEVTFMDTKVDCLKMEDAITYVKHEVFVFQVEEKTIYRHEK